MNTWLYRINLFLVILFIVLLIFAVASFFFMVNFFLSSILCLYAVLGITASIGSWQLSNGNHIIALLATFLLVSLSLILAFSSLYSNVFTAYWNWLLIGFITLGFGGLFQAIFNHSHWLRIPALLCCISGYLGIVLTLGFHLNEKLLYIGTTLSLILHFVFFGFLVLQSGLSNRKKLNK